MRNLIRLKNNNNKKILRNENGWYRDDNNNISFFSYDTFFFLSNKIKQNNRKRFLSAKPKAKPYNKTYFEIFNIYYILCLTEKNKLPKILIDYQQAKHNLQHFQKLVF